MYQALVHVIGLVHVMLFIINVMHRRGGHFPCAYFEIGGAVLRTLHNASSRNRKESFRRPAGNTVR